MLSQNIPSETVTPSSRTFMPENVKSAYVKLVRNANDQLSDELNSSRSRVNHMDQVNTSPEELQENYGRIRSSLQRVPSCHEIVTSRNMSERISDLERTNLNLRRMLNVVNNDPSRNVDRVSGTPGKLLVNRANFLNSSTLGLPTQREGRIGSSWRHIKQTNNYTNSNLLFVDGTVRINDSAKFPKSSYGYPPKMAKYDEDLIGIGSGSNAMTQRSMGQFQLDAPQAGTHSTSALVSRSNSVRHFDNQYRDRAKKGFEYWPKESKFPENNKRKAKLYTTGAYKTFYGLSDSVLKL